MSRLCRGMASRALNRGRFLGHLSNNRTVLWLTPLFSVDYTRSIARVAAQLSVDHSGGNGRPGPAGGGWHEGRKDTRGRLGHNEPLESVGRVSLEERTDSRTIQGIAWSRHKGGVGAQPRPDVGRAAIPLNRDPWCGTHISPEILFPLKQSGQVMYWGAGSAVMLNAPIRSGRGACQNFVRPNAGRGTTNHRSGRQAHSRITQGENHPWPRW
jgi:hypothetical protein